MNAAYRIRDGQQAIGLRGIEWKGIENGSRAAHRAVEGALRALRTVRLRQVPPVTAAGYFRMEHGMQRRRLAFDGRRIDSGSTCKGMRCEAHMNRSGTTDDKPVFFME